MLIVLRHHRPCAAHALVAAAGMVLGGTLARYGAIELAGILPFFAVYAAWGMLRDDTEDYAMRALGVHEGLM